MTEEIYNPDDVLTAFRGEDYASVLKAAMPHALAGNADAQCMISFLYQSGSGVPRDLVKAEEWLLKATAQDSALAWNNLGTLYAVGGPGLSQGQEKAPECYLRAKKLGFNCAYPYPPGASQS